MKILQINKFPSLKGGPETVMFDTTGLLKQTGHEVVLFATDEGEIVYDPTYTIHYPARNAPLSEKANYLLSFFHNKEAARKLEGILEKEKPDIAHIHLYQNSFSNNILRILKKRGIPVVMTLHDYRQICPTYLLYNKKGTVCEKCKGGKYYNSLLTQCGKDGLVENILLTAEMYYRRIFLKTEAYVDRFIAVSNFVYNKHNEFNPSIAAKTTVIHNPVSIDRKNNKTKGSYFLYIGRISPEKGIKILLKTFEELPQFQLKIAGKIEEPIQKASANIEFVGFKSKMELKELICGAMFVIVPSECYETFGMSCAESLAIGTPVIASNIGALPELVEDGKNGLLFDAGNISDLKEKIAEASIMTEQEYSVMSEYAKKSMSRLSDEEYIIDLLNLYHKLIRENK